MAWRGAGDDGVDVYQDGRACRVIRESAGLLDSAAASLGGGVNFAAQGKPEYLRQERVSAGYFRILGVRPRLGREFTPEEDRPGGPAAAVLSDALWQRAFHADAGVIGRGVMLGGEPGVAEFAA